MSKLVLIISLLFISVTVMAAHCVKDAEAIDAALARIDLSEDQQSQVITLRDEGMALHSSGDHRGAERKLAEGMRVLLENVISSTPMEHQMGMGQGMEGGGCSMGGMDHGMEGGGCCSGMGGMEGGGCSMGGMDHDMEAGGMEHDMEGMGDM